MSISKRKVYLYKFDINEYGAVMETGIKDPIEYLLLYALVFDQVILQSSAFYKSKVLSEVLKTYPQIFQMVDENNEALIARYRGIGESSDEEYIDSRLSKTSKSNPEHIAYVQNGYMRITSLLNNTLSGIILPKADLVTDTVFRRRCSNLTADIVNICDYTLGLKIDRYIKDFAEGENVFQTFILKNKLQSRYGNNNNLIGAIGRIFRSQYYCSNAEANGCYDILDRKVDYDNVQSFVIAAGVKDAFERIVNIRDTELFMFLKNNINFKNLVNAYFVLPDDALDECFRIKRSYSNSRTKKKQFEIICRKYGLDAKSIISSHKELKRIVGHIESGGVSIK